MKTPPFNSTQIGFSASSCTLALHNSTLDDKGLSVSALSALRPILRPRTLLQDGGGHTLENFMLILSISKSTPLFFSLHKINSFLSVTLFFNYPPLMLKKFCSFVFWMGGGARQEVR